MKSVLVEADLECYEKTESDTTEMMVAELGRWLTVTWMREVLIQGGVVS